MVTTSRARTDATVARHTSAHGGLARHRPDQLVILFEENQTVAFGIRPGKKGITLVDGERWRPRIHTLKRISMTSPSATS